MLGSFEKESSIYQNNFKILSEIGPAICNKLKALEFENRKFEVVKTKNNLENLKVYNKERKYIVHSNIDPYLEAERIDEYSSDDGVDTIIILGFGLGYHIEHLINKYPQKNKIIIEPDAGLFNTCLEVRSIGHILNSNNALLILSSDPVDISHMMWQLLEDGLINNVRFAALASYLVELKEFWTRVQEEFVKVYRTLIVNVHTNQFFKFTWAENILKNIKHIPESATINEFVGKFENIPAIIVSNGPSLSDNVSYLKNFKNRALIIAAGSAINTLIASDIVPDIMLGIDGGEIMSNIYNSINRNDILFAYNLNIHSDCVDRYNGPKLYFRTNSELKAKYIEEKLNQISVEILSGASCANVATDFAIKLGCNPIVYVGQDLCYFGDRSHSNRIIDESRRNQFKQAVDMDGNIVETEIQLLNMKDWFERYIRSDMGKRTFINASTRGLPIEGMLRMDIQQAAENYCISDTDIKEKIKSLTENSITHQGVSEKDIDELLAYIYAEAERIRDLSNRRIKIVSDILNNLNRKKSDWIVKKREQLNQLTEDIETSEFYINLVSMGGGDFFLAVKNEAEEAALKEKDIHKKLRILYEGLKKQYEETLNRTLFIKELLKKELDNIKAV